MEELMECTGKIESLKKKVADLKAASKPQQTVSLPQPVEHQAIKPEEKNTKAEEIAKLKRVLEEI